MSASSEPQAHGVCQNCQSPLYGDHCYQCGQPVRGLVRQFSSILGDFVDSVLNFDSRTFRTLGPMLFRPGHLSLEYFAGRRVRYVSPVRLFFFFCVLAFLVAQMQIDLGTGSSATTSGDRSDVSNSAILEADTVEEVERLRDQAILEMDQAIQGAMGTPAEAGIRVGMNAAKSAINNAAERRIAELSGTEYEPPKEDGKQSGIYFGGERWHATENPLQIPGIPAVVNAWLNQQAARADQNVQRIKEDPNLIKDAFLSSMPATLFVLLPVFALLLKLAYLFKRRLYMEHLIVALHSHAFLCASLLLILLFGLLSDWLAFPWLVTVIGWLEFGLFWWIPIYLLLAQKRVYGQGWIMTLLKFALLGTSYLLLISVGASVALLGSLVWM